MSTKPKLTKTQHAIFQHLANGIKPVEIAERLACSVKTIELHKSIVFKQYGYKSATHAVACLIRKKLIK